MPILHELAAITAAAAVPLIAASAGESGGGSGSEMLLGLGVRRGFLNDFFLNQPQDPLIQRYIIGSFQSPA